jgi:hypothetical protein
MKPTPKRDAVDKSAPRPKPWYARPSWVSKPKPKPKPSKPTAMADAPRPKAVYRPISEMEGSMAPDSLPPAGSLPKIKMALKRRDGAVTAALAALVPLDLPVRVKREPENDLTTTTGTGGTPLPPATTSQFSFEMPVRPKIEPEGDNINNAPPPAAAASTFSYEMPMRIKKEPNNE